MKAGTPPMIEMHDDWLLVRGSSMTVAAGASGNYVLGYGVVDLAVACVEGFARGDDVGFVRLAPKAHGLRLLEEGAHMHFASAGRTERRLDAEQWVRSSRHAVDKPSVPHSAEYRGLPSGCTTEGLVRHLSSRVLLHSGEFILSGGGHAKAYVDTIPAATCFKTLCCVAALAELLIEPPSLILAPPYGGVSLGIFLAMYWRVDAAVPLRSDRPCEGLVDTLGALPDTARVLLVDDYFSSGSTASRILSGYKKAVTVFAICKTAGQVGTLSADALLVNEGGRVQPSEALTAGL